VKAILLGLIAGLTFSGSALAQTASFDFRGETPSQVVDLSGRNCERRREDGSISCLVLSQQMGGVDDVSFSQMYYNGHLYGVVGIFDADEYTTMLTAFTAKYGRPRMSTATWQNRAGASLQNDIATWTFAEGTLTLKHLGSRITNSEFQFDSPRYAPPAAAPKVDF